MFANALLARPPIRREGNNLIYETPGLSDDWEQRQKEAPDRYEANADEDPTIARDFGHFIAACIVSAGKDRSATVLDIGCGITRKRPDYFAELGLTRLIGLEPLNKLVDRDFPCLVGATAEDVPLKDGTIDFAVSATAWDHIEDEDGATVEMTRYMKPGGSFIWWQGLYEPEMCARIKTYEPTMRHPLPIAMARAAAEAGITGLRMAKRRRHLQTGADIDNVHFRWYTRERLDASLARWGLTKVREFEPPASNSIFVEARVHG